MNTNKLILERFVLIVLCTVLNFVSVTAQNPIITDVFTADPAPLVYNNTVYLYAGHDTATVNANTYQMPDWLVLVLQT